MKVAVPACAVGSQTQHLLKDGFAAFAMGRSQRTSHPRTHLHTRMRVYWHRFCLGFGRLSLRTFVVDALYQNAYFVANRNTHRYRKHPQVLLTVS